MAMIKKLLLILLIFPLFLEAQIVSDAKLWTGVTVSKKVNDFDFSFKNQIRFNENMSHLYKVFSDLGAEYKITKGLYAETNYRFNRYNDYETSNYAIYHRFSLGLAYKHKVNLFRFAVKNRIQYATSKSNKIKGTINRTKFTITYKANDQFRPYAFYELFYLFNSGYIVATRFSLGAKYAINKNNSIKAYYFFEDTYNISNLKHNHIWGLSYSIKL